MHSQFHQPFYFKISYTESMDTKTFDWDIAIERANGNQDLARRARRLTI